MIMGAMMNKAATGAAGLARAWVAAVIVCGLCGYAAVGQALAQPPTAGLDAAGPDAAGLDAAALQVHAGWLTAAPLPYKEIRRDVAARPGRRAGLNLVIAPSADQSQATQAELVSTVVRAAVGALRETGQAIAYVSLVLPLPDGAAEEIPLATATYIPDAKGYDGESEFGPWENVMAVQRGFTAREIDFLARQFALRVQAQADAVLDEDAVRAEVERAMGLAPDTVNPDSNELEYIDVLRAPGPEADEAAQDDGAVGAESKLPQVRADELVAGVKARLAKQGGQLAGDFELLDITSHEGRDYIFAGFRLHKNITAPGELQAVKKDARLVAGLLVEELRAMGIKVGQGGAVAVLRVYDLRRDETGAEYRNLFGVMSCGHHLDDITWESVDAN